MKKLLLLALLLAPLCASATTVTAHVTDSQGSVYQNCRYNINLLYPGGGTGLVYYINTTQVIQQTSLSGALCDSSGNLSLPLTANDQLTPALTKWRFSICNQTGAYCFNYDASITGTTQDISAGVAAAAALLPGTNANPIGNATQLTGKTVATPTTTSTFARYNGTSVDWFALFAATPSWTGRHAFTAGMDLSGISAGTIPLPTSSPVKSTVTMNRVTSASDLLEYGAVFCMNVEDTPFLNSTPNPPANPYKVPLYSCVRRSGTRTDWVWGFNPVVEYFSGGAVQGIEVDIGNYYQDYVVGGADTNTYAGISVVSGGTKWSDTAVAMSGTGGIGWRRGLRIDAVSDRAIEVNNNPTLTMLVNGNGNMHVANGATWVFSQQTGVSNTPVLVLVPNNDTAGPILYGTNAANNAVNWQITKSGSGQFLGGMLIGSGINIDGGGFKHVRKATGCTTAASAGATCTDTITWGTAFASTAYTPVCMGEGVVQGVPLSGGITAKAAGTMTFQTVAATAAAAQYGNIDCVAVHD